MLLRRNSLKKKFKKIKKIKKKKKQVQRVSPFNIFQTSCDKIVSRIKKTKTKREREREREKERMYIPGLVGSKSMYPSIGNGSSKNKLPKYGTI
jgi:hypothetical protein